MLNKWIKAAVGAVVGIGIAATSFGAPTSFVTPTYVGLGTSMPGVRISLPVSASGDTISFILATNRVIGWNPAGTTSTYPQVPIVWALGAQAAGDSVAIAVDAGARPLNYSPGWLAIDTFATHINTLGGNQTITGTTIANPVKVSNGLASTWFPAPYWRVRILTKSAISAGTQFEMRFPHAVGVTK